MLQEPVRNRKWRSWGPPPEPPGGLATGAPSLRVHWNRPTPLSPSVPSVQDPACSSSYLTPMPTLQLGQIKDSHGKGRGPGLLPNLQQPLMCVTLVPLGSTRSLASWPGTGESEECPAFSKSREQFLMEVEVTQRAGPTEGGKQGCTA